jgi:hypothetical protein
MVVQFLGLQTTTSYKQAVYHAWKTLSYRQLFFILAGTYWVEWKSE